MPNKNTNDIVAENIAAEAMAHLFLGLMKADGVITPAEEAKMQHLSRTYQEDLPCDLPRVLSHIDNLRADHTLERWHPNDHLVAGFELLDKFIAMKRFLKVYVTNLMEMMEDVMGEDGIDDNEAVYIKKMDQELTKRFLSLIN